MKIRYWIVFVALVYSSSSSPAAEGIDFEITADYFGKYIWRGQNLDDESVFQPGFSASYKGFTASIWGSLEMTNVNSNSSNLTEVDYSVDYSGTFPGIEGLGYSIGMIYYDFPNTGFDSTIEIYWELNFDLPLNPSMMVYHDVDEVDGSYISLAFGHSIEKVFELSPDLPVGMEIGASLGWGSSSYNNSYWGVDGGKMQDFTFSIGFPVYTGSWTIKPNINYSTILSDSIRATTTKNDNFWAGVGISISF